MTVKDTSLAQEMTEQIQLGLLGTVGKLSKQLRAIDRIAPQLRDGGVVRKIHVDRNRRRRSVGIAAASRHIQAFGGLLYGVAAVSHELASAGSDIVHDGRNSRIDVGDMSMLEYERRIEWKTCLQVYDLLDELFAAEQLPDLVMVDIPLILGRDVYAQILAEDEDMDLYLKQEVEMLRDRIEGFWDRNYDRCYPMHASGPRIVSLHRGHLRNPLRMIQAHGQTITPDPIDGDVQNMVSDQWTQVLSIGVERMLMGILTPDTRTAAFQREEKNVDYRAFPKTLLERGTLTFHYLTGLRGRPVHVETLGSAPSWHDRGGAAAMDDLASDLMAVTYFDHRGSLPLPIWYARQAVRVIKKKGLLEFYKRETLRTMQEEQVDRAWLAGWEVE